MHRNSPLRVATAGASLLAILSPACFASGFQILEQSASRLGTAFSGTASIADDATTAFFNPAGMSRLDQREFAVVGHMLLIESEFSDRGSQAAAGTPLQRPLPGLEGTTDEPGLTANVYLVQPVSERWTFGLGVSAPFGLVSEYEDGWQGRYHATESELQVFNINPSVAFEVTEQLSLGFGLNYQYADVTLENAVDSFSACFSAGGPVAACTAAHGGPANPDADSAVQIEGDDDAVVVDLSLHWQPTDATSLGLVWRQGADFNLGGDASFTLSESCAADPFCSGALGMLEGPVRAETELPGTLTASVSHRVAERWTVHADIARTGWSSLERVGIVNTEIEQEVSALDLDYNDTFRVAGGTTFALNESMTWRFGLAFDEAPQENPALVTPRIPDADRVWLSTGFNYRFGPGGSLDVGYAHLFVDDSKIDSTEQGNRLAGRFESSVDILGLQFNWNF
ncbi:MAG: outer membrane protein transport protein [Wenzhouxiangellaceae bacterium]